MTTTAAPQTQSLSTNLETPHESRPLVFNGIDAMTGQYLFVASPKEASRAARGLPADPAHLRDLARWREIFAEKHLAVGFGIDPRKIEECGWGVIVPHDLAPEIRQALEPLLRLRREQATTLDPGFYRELVYRPGESKLRFLARHGVGPDPVDPAKLPYYLLIVGDPRRIPYNFQYQLDIQYAVGRICFDTPEEYARYAASVVAAERGEVRRRRRLDVVAVENPDDPATRLSLKELATPMADILEKGHGTWAIERSFGDQAHKRRWLDILSGQDSPALLFTASHGLGFPCGAQRQRDIQGALLCQDWPGPRSAGEPLTDTHYLAAHDLDREADVAGLVTFHFACFSAGTPQYDSFWHRGGTRHPLAPEPFVARLPQRLLTHPNGGALAVIGHVDQAWGYSFDWPDAGRQLEVWKSAFGQLLAGYPVGAAMECFNQRYAEISCELTHALDDAEFGGEPDHLSLAGLWTSNNDARSYMVFGDPAVRLAVAYDETTEGTTTQDITTQDITVQDTTTQDYMP